MKSGTNPIPPFEKGGTGGIKIMLPYNKDLKKYSRELRKNMTEAENFAMVKDKEKATKGISVLQTEGHR